MPVAEFGKPVMTKKTLPQESAPQESATGAGRKTFTPYVMTWCTLAALSLAYLGVLAAQPAMLAGHLDPGPNALETGSIDTAAEVRTLRDTIDLFRNELIEIRAQVSNQTDVTSDLMSRISSVETPAAGSNQAVADNGAAEPAIINGKDERRTAAVGPEAGQKQTAAVPAPVRKAANAGRKNVETGSVTAPATGANSDISFGPPVVKQAARDQGPPPGTRNMIGAQIATGPSVDSLRLSWTLLSERHADSFRALEPRYATTGEGPNKSYSLIVGPMPTVDEARRLCEDLALKATPCRVSQFTGDALL